MAKVFASLKKATSTHPKLTVHISGYTTRIIFTEGKKEAMHKQEFGFWIDLTAVVESGIGRDGTEGGYLYADRGYLGCLPGTTSDLDRKGSKWVKERGYPGFLSKQILHSYLQKGETDYRPKILVP